MLYKYTSWIDDNTRNNIINDVLYFNTPENLNDPFDIYADFQVTEDDRSQLEHMLAKYGCDIESIKRTRLVPASDMVELWQIADRTSYSNSKYGITCFSKDADNVLMWSHYADKHKGICLGFDIDTDDITLDKFFDKARNYDLDYRLEYQIFQVKYQEERPKFGIREDFSIREVLRTKSNLWEPEHEVRIMVVSQSHMIFPSPLYYQGGKLKEIILGAMMPTVQFLDFLKFLSKNNIIIRIKFTCLDSGTYCLNIVDISYEQLWQLEDNIHSILNKYLEIIESTTIFRDLLRGFSRRNKKRIWYQAIYSMPIYYYSRYFPAFLNEPVCHYLENGSAPAPNRAIALEITKYNSFIETQIQFLRLRN